MRLERHPVSAEGELIAESDLRHSHEALFRGRLPWRVGIVRLDVGCSVVVHRHRDCKPAPTRVRLMAAKDPVGRTVYVALPAAEPSTLGADPNFHDFTTIHP